MPTPKWRTVPPAVWASRIRSLACSRQIRAHVACIVWWDLSLGSGLPQDWLLDLREQYTEHAKEDLTVLADALAAAGYPPDVARRRAFKDVLSGYIPKKRSASSEDTSAL